MTSKPGNSEKPTKEDLQTLFYEDIGGSNKNGIADENDSGSKSSNQHNEKDESKGKENVKKANIHSTIENST